MKEAQNPLKNFFNVYLFLRQRMSGGGSERGRHRSRSRLQDTSCQHRAWRRARTHKPWDHVLSQSWTLSQLNHLGTPNFLKKCLFIFERVRDRARAGEGQREGDPESETGSGLRAVSTEPDVGLETTDREIMTWAEVGPLTNWATQAPPEISFKVGNKTRLLTLVTYTELITGNPSHSS